MQIKGYIPKDDLSHGANCRVQVAARAKLMESRWKKDEIGVRPERQPEEE